MHIFVLDRDLGFGNCGGEEIFPEGVGVKLIIWAGGRGRCAFIDKIHCQ